MSGGGNRFDPNSFDAMMGSILKEMQSMNKSLDTVTKELAQIKTEQALFKGKVAGISVATSACFSIVAFGLELWLKK